MIKLIEVVDDFLLEEERLDNSKKDLYIHYAISGLRDLNQDLTGAVKRKKLDVNTSNNTLPLPSDVQKIIGVYTYSANGRLVGLGRDNKIFKDTNGCGNTVEPTSNKYGGYFIGTPSASRHYSNGYATGAFYGVGGQQINGNYRVNLEMNRIELGSSVDLNEVIIDYLGDIEQINGEFMVHEFLREPIKAWIRWKATKSRNIQEFDYFKREYYRTKRVARNKVSSPSIEQMYQAARSGISQAPKQ